MHICVVNPVNQSFKVLCMLEKLVCFGEAEVVLTGTVTATESISSFKVYLSHVVSHGDPSRRSDKFDKAVAIFDSISGEWKGFLGPPLELSLEWRIVACNGDLYAAVDGNPIRLVRLSTERGRRYLWDVALPLPSEGRGEISDIEYCLVGHRGRLLCGYGTIWMLDDARQLWVEIAGSCPPDILPTGDPNTQYLTLKNVHVSGDLVIFFYQLLFHHGGKGDEDRVECPVAYNMLRHLWLKVPQSVAQLGDGFQPMPNLRL